MQNFQAQTQDTQSNSSSPKKRNLLSIGDASEYLGVSIDTLRRWEKKGRISPLRSPGGHRYFPVQDLDSLFGKKYTRDAIPKPRTQKLKEVEAEEVKKPESFSEPAELKIATQTDQSFQSPPAAREIKIPVIKPITLQTSHIANEEAAPPANVTQTSSTNYVPTTIFHQQDAPPPPPPPLPPPVSTTPEPIQRPSIPLSQEQQAKLQNIIQTNKKSKKFTIRTKWIISALITFAILDLVFAYIWFSSSSIISPMP